MSTFYSAIRNYLQLKAILVTNMIICIGKIV